MSWKSVDRYSKDYIELQTKDKVKFYKTPDAILQKQLEIWTRSWRRSRRKIRCSRRSSSRRWHSAERAVAWDIGYNISRRMAYNHYFGGKKAAPAQAAPAKAEPKKK